MVVVETSLEAYHKLLIKLNDKQTAVYSKLEEAEKYGWDMTNFEIAKLLHWPINCVTPRVKELRDAGLVVKSQVRRQETGRRAIAWKVRG
jgi:predicted transcriptional regulator